MWNDRGKTSGLPNEEPHITKAATPDLPSARSGNAQPYAFNLDFSLVKQFKIRESKSLELRIETFNNLNHFNPDVLSASNWNLNYNFTTGAQTNVSFGVISAAAV